MSLYAWTPYVTAEALRIVRNVMKSTGNPMSTKEIFKLAVAQKPQKPIDPPPPIIKVRKDGSIKQIPYPSHPEHPIRSVRYLKQVVLPAMEHSLEIEKFHTKAALSQTEIEGRLASLSKSANKAKQAAISGTLQSVWLWRFRSEPPPQQEKEELEKLYGEEVGVGRDLSHLSKRRRAARVKKVEKAVKFMRSVQLARKTGILREGSEQSTLRS
ncbi:hypothetical protein NEOLEDRAFT_1180684 [Neolentinus lepideus HHB14362 ss-1]|uniref:Uncharacterized protein n=1 Tax=Neolentinus lepideus HHB14362 ss-1 TaxID=1314782 RepID=A0A165QRM1_9AGAM|nr:hypothetical protein NEOLEDRAFT_1180684 [Neolentinus lepideus HHB14362 ss-1]